MGPQRIVVVGASLAGARSAEAIRSAGFDGAVTLVGDDPRFPPVDRPPLSKGFLSGRAHHPAPLVRVMPELDVGLLLGRRASSLDPLAHLVRFADGSALEYDGLVIATGASARPLPRMGLCARNVHLLRTVDDAVALRAQLEPGVRVCVIGAGVLGCEIAATARGLGASVTVVDLLSHPMLRVLGPKAAALVAGLHQQHGVTMLLGRPVLDLEGESDVEAVSLEGARVEADVVVVAIGAMPETSWLAGSGVEVSDGVICDEACFVPGSDHTIVAAGDVARWRHPLLRRSVRVEHWTNAASQGQVAGRNLIAALTGQGEVRPYDALPYFWSDQYDWKLQFVGELGEEVILEDGSAADGRFELTYRTEGEVVGALCVNRPARLAFWRRTITARLSRAGWGRTEAAQ